MAETKKANGLLTRRSHAFWFAIITNGVLATQTCIVSDGVDLELVGD